MNNDLPFEYVDKLRQQIRNMKEQSDLFYSSPEEKEEMQVTHLRKFVEEISTKIMPQLAEDSPDTTVEQREEARRRWLLLAYQLIEEVLSESEGPPGA
jgi:hypothetical protein